MKILKAFAAASALITAVVLARNVARLVYLYTRTEREPDGKRPPERSPYAHMVEETLRQGPPDTAVVRAFEEALEEEFRYEKQLARDSGLRI